MYSNFPHISPDIIAPIAKPPKGLITGFSNDCTFTDNYSLHNKDKYYKIDEIPQNKLKQIQAVSKIDYKSVINTNSKFKQPADSNTLVETIDYKKIKKLNPDTEFVYQLYNKMVSNINYDVEAIELKQIEGNIDNDNMSKVHDMYNPVYSMIDLTNNNFIPTYDTIERKYEGYQPNGRAMI